MSSKPFIPIKRISAWRKLSQAFWRAPNDPSVYGSFEIDATPAMDFLAEVKQNHAQNYTLTTLVAKALGLTIAKHPTVNTIIKWGRIHQRQTVDVFLQIAVADQNNSTQHHLSGIKVSQIDRKSIKEIHEEISTTSNKIRNNNDKKFGKFFNVAQRLPIFLLRPLVRVNEFLTFNLNLHAPSLGLNRDPFGSAMLTNIGSLGLARGFAPLVPATRTPLILSLGAVQKKAWVEDEKIVIKPILEISVTFDHRLIDGLHAAEMHKTLCHLLTHPKELL